MATKIRKVEYFQCIVKDEPGEAYKLLANLKSLGVNLLAFNVIPIGGETAQLVLFPEGPSQFAQVATDARLQFVGPHRAFFVTGDDELGAFAEIHHRLFEGNINVESSSGVTDGRGAYGYIVYVQSSDYSHAAEVLGI